MSPLPKKTVGTMLLSSSPKSIAKAAELLKKGGLVAFPTETVYGLGAIATDSTAVRKIFIAKGRPADNPLIVHLADPRQLEEVAIDLPPEAKVLIERFWPGPLSLVLKSANLVAPDVSAGLSTVAVRMPAHPTALKLIKAAGAPIAAPSANLAGRPSPTSYKHVLKDLTGSIDAVIRGANCQVGIESTVLDLTGENPVILRPGGITGEQLEKILGCRVLLAGHKHLAESPSSPGMKYRHYSPEATLVLITGFPERRAKLIGSLMACYRRKGLKVGFLSRISKNEWSEDRKIEKLAAGLYQKLRAMDAAGVDLILVEETAVSGLGLAVMNRLRKAASRVIRV
jgi:L-threonylcarbamoyladenylate synthase